MWEAPFCGDFQGLWEKEGNGFCFPLFPSDQHFHPLSPPFLNECVALHASS
jgi:hypothetical protein